MKWLPNSCTYSNVQICNHRSVKNVCAFVFLVPGRMADESKGHLRSVTQLAQLTWFHCCTSWQKLAGRRLRSQHHQQLSHLDAQCSPRCQYRQCHCRLERQIPVGHAVRHHRLSTLCLTDNHTINNKFSHCCRRLPKQTTNLSAHHLQQQSLRPSFGIADSDFATICRHIHLTQLDLSYSQFQHLLKTILFESQWDHSSVWISV